MTKPKILERLEKLIENAKRYSSLDSFRAGLAAAVEILEDEEIEKLEVMFQMQQALDERIMLSATLIKRSMNG
ncbi:hypothetical protein LR68_01270 [Anoxybacillus sp. BCO1]|nr:hypothetical protein LR68_01270 [Anoxybacillus sp. BCO1]